jgi:hypothetical protein
MRRRECSDSFSYESIIVAAEAHEQKSELGLGAQKKTRGRPVKILSVWKTFFVCNIWSDLKR